MQLVSEGETLSRRALLGYRLHFTTNRATVSFAPEISTRRVEQHDCGELLDSQSRDRSKHSNFANVRSALMRRDACRESSLDRDAPQTHHPASLNPLFDSRAAWPFALLPLP